MTDTNEIQEMRRILTEGVKALDPRVQEQQFAERLAQCVIDGVEVSQKALETLALDFYEEMEKRPDRGEIKVLSAGAGVASNVLGYGLHKQVSLSDGRVACEDGWNYENVEPGRKVPGRPTPEEEERTRAFRKALLDLDRALTRQEPAATSPLRQVDLNKFEEWYERELYLSDGGYSRLIWLETRGLELTSNSSPLVRIRWSEAKVERAVVERLIAAEWKRLTG